MSTTLLIDGSHLTYRSYHTFTLFSNSKGEPTGIPYGFFSVLSSYNRKISTRIIVAWDSKPYWRSTIQPDYKDKRVEYTEEERKTISNGFKLVQEMCTYSGIIQISKPTFEADDIIALCVNKLKEDILIVSGDKDLLQLVDDSKNIKLLRPKMGDLVLYDEAKIKEHYGITKSQIPIYLSIRGDKGDNIIGIRGLGEVKTAKLLNTVQDPLAYIKQNYLADFPRIENNLMLTDLTQSLRRLQKFDFQDIKIQKQELINLNVIMNRLEIKAFTIRDIQELFAGSLDEKLKLKEELLKD